MAAAFDTAAQNHTNGVTNFGTNITVGNNANRVLVVQVVTLNGESVTSITGAGATWGGTAFGTIVGAGGARGETWYGIAPSTGAQTVTVNFSASLSNEGEVHVHSWYNAHQTTPLANYDGFNAGSNANINRNVTTTNGDGASCQLSDADANTLAPSCTPAIDVFFKTGGGYEVASTHALATGTSTNFAWTNNNGKVYQGVAIAQAVTATSSLEWKQPTSQPTAHFMPDFISVKPPDIVPYLLSTPTRVTGTTDWIQATVDITWI